MIEDNERVLAEGAHPRRRQPVVRRFASAAEADRHDLEYWQHMPVADRLALVWQLSLEQWRLAGFPPHEPGLCRSVADVRRR